MSPLGSLQSDLITYRHCLHLSQFHCVFRCLTQDRSAGGQLPSLPLAGPELDATHPLFLPVPSPALVLPWLDSASRSQFLPKASGGYGGPQALSPDSSLLLPSSSLDKGTRLDNWP